MMSRRLRQLILMTLDLIAAVSAVLVAFAIRFAFEGRPIPWQYLRVYFYSLPITIPIRLLVYHWFGLYRQIWSHASVLELLSIIGAVTVDTLLSALVIFLLPHTGYPRSIFVISWFLTIGLLGAIRLALRVRHEWIRSHNDGAQPTNRALIFGAGDAGVLLAREFGKHPELDATLVGFVDDDPYKEGLRLAGKPVLGTRTDLKRLAKEYKVTNLLIAMPSARGHGIREIAELGRSAGLKVKTLPGLFELMNGSVSVSQIRDVQIEDILGRDEVKVDLAAIAAYLSDEVVLVTGAGGSIGSELCRQVARFSPKQLILLGHGENSIYEIHMELLRRFPDLDLRPIIADIRDENRIRQVFEQYRPGVVFHAAAHKHVPLMEFNPTEAIKNNVFGTLNVAKAADFYNAKRFVLISSDKAVNPTSVMGATKRAAECIVQSLARTSQTVFVAVRFGNVLGSRGSVIPLFKRQIAAGGPVTVTDPRMVRYFMTIPEAAQLVIQAASMGHGGEVFILDMGDPVRIVDLARDLIRLSGLEPDVDIRIEFSGVRPGEKLFEELLTAEEGTQATMHERIFVARPDSISPHVLQSFLDSVGETAATGHAGNEEIRSMVRDLVGQVDYHGAVGVGG